MESTDDHTLNFVWWEIVVYPLVFHRLGKYVMYWRRKTSDKNVNIFTFTRVLLENKTNVKFYIARIFSYEIKKLINGESRISCM
jgi:hypothetical protein